MQQTFAATHNVKMVVVAIGGNDFNFPLIVSKCVVDFLGSPSWAPNYCNDDASVKASFTPAHISAVQVKIAKGLQNVRAAMRNAGYADTAWSMVVQTYPSPIPTAIGFRHSQIGFTRQSTGGCGADLLAAVGGGGPDRMDQPDPDGRGRGHQPLDPGVAAPQLLGTAGPAKLPASSLERRCGPRWNLHDLGHRTGRW
jgi:hypothetical protein